MSTVAIGGVVGGGLAFVVVDQPAGALVLAAGALGAALANAVRQALGPRF